MSTRAQLSEAINRLLPGEQNKRIREAILTAASYSGSRTDQLRQSIDEANRVRTGLLIPGTTAILSDTSAELSGYVWVIDFAVKQPEGVTAKSITAPDETFTRDDYFIGLADGTIEYRAGTIDSLGNSFPPEYDPATEVVISAVRRNPDGSNDEAEIPEETSLIDFAQQNVIPYVADGKLKNSGIQVIFDALGLIAGFSFPTSVKGSPATNPDEFVTLDQLEAVAGPQGTQLRYGGVVQWTGVGFNYIGYPSGYDIEGVPYTAEQTPLVLDAANASLDRRDRFKLTVNGWEVDTGTPGAGVAPSVNSITEIDRGDAIVLAGATTPTVPTNEPIYAENAAGEWAGTHTGSGTGNPDSTANPDTGSKSYEASNVIAGSSEVFTRSANLPIESIDSLSLRVALKGNMNQGRSLRIQFLSEFDTPVSNLIAMTISRNTTAYQDFAITKAQMGFAPSATHVRKFRVTYSGTGGPAVYSGYFLDNIKIQGGAVDDPINSGTLVEEAPNDGIYYGRRNKTWQAVTEEAPNDGQEYVRKNKAWVVATPLNGSIVDGLEASLADSPGTSNRYVTVNLLNSYAYVQEAPINGNHYARKNGAWVAFTPFVVAGTPSEGQVVTYVSGVPTWATPSGGGGISAIGTIDSVTKSANGGVISGSNLIYQTADASFPGLVSTGSQTFAGDKTFTGRIIRTGFLTNNSQVAVGSLELQSFSQGNGWLAENAYYNGTSWKYRNTWAAGLFYFYGNEGQFRFFESGSANADLPSGGNIATLKTTSTGNFAVGLMNEAKGNYTNARLLVFGASGNVSIGNIIDSGFRLDVTGNSRFTGNTTFTGKVIIGNEDPSSDLSLVKSGTTIQAFIRNTSNTGFADTRIVLANDTNVQGGFFLGSSTRPLDADTVLVYANKTLRFMTNNTVSSGGTDAIIFQAGGNNTSQETMRVLGGSGGLQFAEAKNLIFGTATGSKIGTATNQKIAFWNKTPIIQPTTAITGSARVAGGGAALTDTDTFGGYTIQQLAAILINTGLAA